ncbi:hypothetical protein X798_01888 [Onchocerca flexuosa]|uniref:Uncharacterized protein n=1 Tax=Onchocerca flexuosa TaxID=387005 RepID=A0A238C0N3_9BILA|nr:hypothetical protein X798_01888 [Onchocerca flexuosa]
MKNHTPQPICNTAALRLLYIEADCSDTKMNHNVLNREVRRDTSNCATSHYSAVDIAGIQFKLTKSRNRLCVQHWGCAAIGES